ncbi:nitroreductase family protein [Propionibacteriaceae bacterium Y2011]
MPTEPGRVLAADLAAVVRRRRTVRQFDPDRPVAEEVVDDLLDLGLRTPSAGNTGGVDLLCLTEPADRARYWQLTAPTPTRWSTRMAAAPVLVLVWTSEQQYRQRYARPDKGWPLDSTAWSAPYWWVDAGMAVQTLLLVATAAGLASAFVGVPPEHQSAVADAFGVPADRSSVGLVAVGHPAAAGDVAVRRRAPRRRRRHRGRWDAPGQ